MASTATERVALFSIKPVYAAALMSGTKQVEFRRQPLPADVTDVIVYATSPLQRVIGSFTVVGVEALSPRQAWSRYNLVGGIEEQSFFDYYAGAEKAYVIRVGRPSPAVHPFALTDISQALRPPQSFMYLRDQNLDQARALLHHGLNPVRVSAVRALVDRLSSAVISRFAG